MALLVALVAGLVVDQAHSLPLLTPGSVSRLVAECACGSCVKLGATPPQGASVSSMVFPVLLQFQILTLFVVPCGSSWVLLSSAMLILVLFGLNKLLNFLEGEAVLEVVIGGAFLDDIFGYGGVLQSLHQSV